MKPNLFFLGCILFVSQALAQGHKTTSSTSSRLVAYTNYNRWGSTGFYQDDSFAFSYSGGRGGDLSSSPFKYDDQQIYVYDTSTGYVNALNFLQTFNAANNIDTAIDQSWDVVSGSWLNSTREVNTYNASNDLTEIVHYNWDTTTSSWAERYEQTRSYDAAHHLITSLSQVVSGTVLVNVGKENYMYDSEGYLLSDSSFDWNTSASSWVFGSVNAFVYNTSHQLIADSSGVMPYFTKDTYTYNPSGNRISATLQYSDSGVLRNIQLNTYTYDGIGDTLVELVKYWDDVTSSWHNTTNMIFDGYTDHQPEVVITQYWIDSSATYANFSKDTSAYNAYGQCTYGFYQLWNNTGYWEWPYNDFVGTRFYYETYTTSVSNISNNNCTASVYPIPTKDQLHVSITWNEPQAFSIEIMDMSGRVVNTRQMPECKTYDGNITLGNLPAGNYIMKMTGTNAQSVQQIVVAK